MDIHMSIITLICIFINPIHTLVFRVVGIYSICGTKYNENEFTRFAYTLDFFIGNAIENQVSMVHWPFQNNVTTVYDSYDVCFDTQKLFSIVPELLLDRKFYAVNKSIILRETFTKEYDWERDAYVPRKEPLHFYYDVYAERSTMILRILTHIPSNMLKSFLDIMSLQSTPISTHSSLVKETEQMTYSGNFYKIDDSFMDVEMYLAWRNFEEVLVIHCKNEDVFTPYYQIMLDILAKMNICAKGSTIKTGQDYSKLHQKIEKIFDESNKTKNIVQIMVGRANYSNDVIKASYYENMFILNPFDSAGYNLPFKWVTNFQNIVRAAISHYSDRRRTAWILELYQNYQNTTLFNVIQKNLATLAVAVATINSEGGFTNMRYQHSLEKTRFKWSDIVKQTNEDQRKFLQSDFVEKIPIDIETKCTQPICESGKEKMFGKIPEDQTSWDEEIGYYCQLCKSNYIKSFSGDDHCKPCEGYYISNKQRTKCIDPLTPTHHNTSEMSGIITLCICIVGSVLCLFAIIIFIKSKDTPIVKTSDFTMSLTHLVSILLIFVIEPVLYLTSPTPKKCIGRTMAIAFLYNLNISIVYTKSHRILKAFSAKTISTRKEVLRATLFQVFNITINLLSASLWLTALWIRKYPGIVEMLDVKQKTKFQYCNNGIDNIILSGLMLLLQLACFIQAFRCRKLPGYVNEAMSTVYALSIVTASLCVMFPIYFFQKLEQNGELVVLLVLTGNSLILLLFMYSKKLYDIMFRTKKNTKAYYRKKQLEIVEVEWRRYSNTPEE